MFDVVRYPNGRGGGMPTLFGWDPFRLMDDLVGSVGAGSTWVAPYGYEETDDGLTITIDVPGVDEKDLDVTLSREGLIVSGKREGRGEFQHKLQLADTLDFDSAEANLRNGVLTISVRKRPEMKPRKIAIAGGTERKALSDRGSESPKDQKAE